MLAVTVMGRPTTTAGARALLMLMLPLSALQLDRGLEGTVGAATAGWLQLLGRPLQEFLLLKREETRESVSRGRVSRREVVRRDSG